MNLRPEGIQTEMEYQAALKEAKRLFDAQEGSPQVEMLDRLVDLIEDYEIRHYPITETT